MRNTPVLLVKPEEEAETSASHPPLAKRQRLSTTPFSHGKIFSSSTTFGQVQWARSKSDGVFPHIPLSNQKDYLEFVVCSKDSEQMSVKCRKCMLQTSSNAQSGVKGISMILFTIKNNQWVNRNPLSPTLHCCRFDLAKFASPAKDLTISTHCVSKASPTPRVLWSQPKKSPKDCSSEERKQKKESKLSPANLPTFGPVYWTTNKRGGQTPYVTLLDDQTREHQQILRFCVVPVYQDPMLRARCIWCLSKSHRSRKQGNGGLRIVDFKIFEDKWVGRHPLDLDAHSCGLCPPSLLGAEKKQKSPENLVIPTKEVAKVETRAESTIPVDNSVDLDDSEENGLLSYGQVEWSEANRVIIQIAGRSQPIVFHSHHKKGNNMMWVRCSECIHLNKQRKIRNLTTFKAFHFMIKDNKWVGERDPRDQKWHGCRLLPLNVRRNGPENSKKPVESKKRLLKKTSTRSSFQSSPETSQSPDTSTAEPYHKPEPPVNLPITSIEWKKNTKTNRKYAFIQAGLPDSSERICFTFSKHLDEGPQTNTYWMTCLKCISVNRKRLELNQHPCPIPNIRVVDQKWCEHPANPRIPHICFTETSSA